jgi:hypothetical protein
MRLRDDYTADCAKGVERWNKVIEKSGVNFQLELPHVAFNRQIGEFLKRQGTPKGEVIVARPNGRSARTSGCRPRPTATSSSR